MDKKTKISFIVLLILQITIIILLFLFMQTRPMLDARAFNQEANLISNWDRFSPQTKIRILDHWEVAEYSAEGKKYLLTITPEYQNEQ